MKSIIENMTSPSMRCFFGFALLVGLSFKAMALDITWLSSREIKINVISSNGVTDLQISPDKRGINYDITWKGYGKLQVKDGVFGEWEDVNTDNTYLLRRSVVGRSVQGDPRFYRVISTPKTRGVYIRFPEKHPAVLERQGLEVPVTNRKEYPVVFNLHGYSENPEMQENLRMPFKHLQDVPEKEFIYVLPEGTPIMETGNPGWPSGLLGWNATDACCVPQDSGLALALDDVEFMGSLAEQMRDNSLFSADRNRFFLTGFSNGAMMSLRLLAERGDLFAAGVIHAGTIWIDPTVWDAPHPVSILFSHGTSDQRVRYNGGGAPELIKSYPGILDTIDMWAEKLGIEGSLQATGERLDLDTMIKGDETEVFRYSDALTQDPSRPVLEHWKINGGPHDPRPIRNGQYSEMPQRIIDFLFEHPKKL